MTSKARSDSSVVRAARARRRRRPGGRPVEWLENRILLSVTFVPGLPVAPPPHADLALGNISGFTPVEPTVAVNPTNPLNVVVSSHAGVRISTNGGATFGSTVAFADPPGTNQFNGDTDLAFDSAGLLYWVNLAGTGTQGIAVSRIDPTTGSSFSTVAISNAGDDKSQIAADATATSPFANNVYVIWTRFAATTDVFFSRSTNQGVSFSTPVQLSNSATEGFVWPSDVAVAPNGDVYVAYHANGTFNSTNGVNGRVLVRRSTDGGVTFGTATQAFTAGTADVTANVQNSVGAIPGTEFWTQGSAEPWILPDPARPGNVYVVACDDPNNIFGNGDNGDVVLARSTDNGATWSRSTISAGPSNSFQVYPTAAIDKTGTIVVAWYDNRRLLTNASARYKLDVMATYSVDGGLTWAPEFMVNDSTNQFDPDPGAVTRFPGPPPTTRIGEYFGISVAGGLAHVAWNGNTFSGSTPINQQVWYDNFPVGGSLVINGDDPGPSGADSILIRTQAGNSANMQVLVNSVLQYAGPKSVITGYTINGGLGDDGIGIDFTGLIGPFVFDGGAGVNSVSVNAGSFIFADDPALHLIQKVNINTSATATFSAATSNLINLNNNSGILNGTGNLEISGIVSWTGGTMGGSGAIHLTSSGTLNISGAALKTLSRTINSDGITNWSGGEISFNGGTFNNNSSSTFNDTTALFPTRMSSAGGTNLFHNAGAFNRVAGGETEVDVPFESVVGGAVSADGQLDLLGGGVGAGLFMVAGTLVIGPAFQMGSLAMISGTGLLRLENTGSMMVGATISSLAGLQVKGSSTVTVVNPITLTAGGSIVVDGGNLICNGAGTAGTVSCLGGGSLTLNSTLTSTGAALVSGAGSVMVLNGALAIVDALTIDGGSAVSLGAGGGTVLRTRGLSITATGRLDLKDDAMIVGAGGPPIDAVVGYLSSGYANGVWNGNGISSSMAAATPGRALGIALAADVFHGFPATFVGQSVDAGSILVRYTLAGDSTLDQKVDIRDLYNIAANWQQSPRRWSQGDFNYNATVDAADLGILSAHWQADLAAPPAQPAAITAPKRSPTRVISTIV